MTTPNEMGSVEYSKVHSVSLAPANPEHQKYVDQIRENSLRNNLARGQSVGGRGY
jgi:hypothetical protein